MKKKVKTDLGFKIRQVLVNYLKTQFVLMIVVVFIVWGIMAVIPNLHPLIEILIVVGSFLALSNLMDLFISPYILGKTTKANPFLLFFSFLIGLIFLGFVGVLIAMPITLVIQTVWSHYNSK